MVSKPTRDAEAQAPVCESERHLCLTRARAAPRRMRSANSSLIEGAVPAGGHSLSAHCDVPVEACNAKPAPHVTQRGRAGARCLGTEEAHHASFLLHARYATLVVASLYPYERALRQRESLSFGARPWYNVPAAASNAKPAPRVTQRRRAAARCLWEGGAALKLSERARRAALVVIKRCPITGALLRRQTSPLGHTTVVRRAGCGLERQASATCHAAQARRRSLSLERRHSTQASCARVPCYAGCGRLMLCRRGLRQQEASPFRHMTAVRRASCGLQRKQIQRRMSRAAHRRACVCRLWGGGAARKLSARARLVTLI